MFRVLIFFCLPMCLEHTPQDKDKERERERERCAFEETVCFLGFENRGKEEQRALEPRF